MGKVLYLHLWSIVLSNLVSWGYVINRGYVGDVSITVITLAFNFIWIYTLLLFWSCGEKYLNSGEE